MAISERQIARPLPHIRYRDVEGSARWLCYALGFEVHSAVRDTNGVMDYVQLTQGRVTIVIKPFDPRDVAVASPDDDQSFYVHVDDVSGHYATAMAEGAEIVIALQDVPRVGRGYSCRDPEGRIWSFGTFDVWRFTGQSTVAEPVDPPEPMSLPEPTPAAVAKPEATTSAVGPMPVAHARRAPDDATARNLALSVLAGGLIGALSVAAGVFFGLLGGAPITEQQIATERAELQRSQVATRHAQQALDGERAAKEQYQRAAKIIEAELTTTKSAMADASTQLQATRAELSTQNDKLRDQETETATLRETLAQSEKQWHAVEKNLTEELDQARAATAEAQSQHNMLEATMRTRFSTLEATLREKTTALERADATQDAAALELRQARTERARSETALQAAIASLKSERQARAAAEERVEALRKQLAGRRAPGRKLAQRTAQQPRPATSKVRPKAVAKKPAVITYSAGDIGFQP